MRKHNCSSPRRGFTILEMMMAMVIFLSVMGAAVSVFRIQSRTVAQHAGRIEAQHNARFALAMLERELRMGGVGLGIGQPSLVHAAPLAVTFNTNLVARDEGDATAVYINQDADPSTVGVFLAARQIKLPGTEDMYPDTTYEMTAGVPGRAETISYWLERDSTSPRNDEHVLYRRVNDAPPAVVTRGVIVGPTDTVFQFFAIDTANKLQPIAATRLPATHVAAMHKAAGDTGALALVDSIRAVRLRLRLLYRDPRGHDAIREFAGRVTILNAGSPGRATCGEAPLGVALTTTVLSDADGVPYVRLTWNASIDENGGEKDVERYAVYRRDVDESAFGEPVVSVPAGQASYSYDDFSVQPGDRVVYGLTAQDCTPASSPIAAADPLTVP